MRLSGWLTYVFFSLLALGVHADAAWALPGCRSNCNDCRTAGPCDCAPGTGSSAESTTPYSPDRTLTDEMNIENANTPPAEQQFNLGEAGPAQAGNQFAMVDSAPNFIGDLYGMGSVIVIVDSEPALPVLPGGGGVVGRQKLSENTSPIPKDRIFLNYSYFHNVRFGDQDLHVNRYTPGFEKTFLDGLGSIELRAPIADTIDSNIQLTRNPDTSTQFGNLTLYSKFLLLNRQNFAVSGGLGVAVPTAKDITLSDGSGLELLRIENDSTHLLPFIGGIYTPAERWFMQGLLQIDLDANGSPVYIRQPSNTLTNVGRYNDNTFLFATGQVGYWHRRGSAADRLSGLASIFELNYNTTLNDNDFVSSNGFTAGAPGTNYEFINVVTGLNFEFYRASTLTAGYVIPLTSGADRAFDGELRLFFNRYF